MADALITKKALAETFRKLLSEKPFTKITVSEVCDQCGINRKSFYYHFSDKYEMVNWIFDYEYGCQSKYYYNNSISKDNLLNLCTYFYNNRNYYKKLFNVEDYNSFSNHFRSFLMPHIDKKLRSCYADRIDEFTLNFFADAVICAIKRWIDNPECIRPEDFVEKIESLVSISRETLQSFDN